jgi:uncharacterized protein (TIGR03437 family)
LAPGTAGLYQFNVTVPASITATGDQVISASTGGASSPTGVFVTVQ